MFIVQEVPDPEPEDPEPEEPTDPEPEEPEPELEEPIELPPEDPTIEEEQPIIVTQEEIFNEAVVLMGANFPLYFTTGTNVEEVINIEQIENYTSEN